MPRRTHHAQRLAAGNWLGVGEGPFWQPPLYPYFLGAVKSLFPESFFYAVRFVQALLGALVCAMSWWIGRTLFNPAVGLLAGVGTALCGPLIFFDGELLPASLAAFVDLLALVVLLRVWRRPSRWGFLGAGVAFGIGALAVPTVLTFAVVVPIVLLWRAPRRQGLVWAGAFSLGVLLAIAPVAWRNWAIGGDGVGISYNAGINLYIGNNPDYAETVAIRPGWEWDELVTQPAREGIERPSAKSAYFAERAWDYIRGDPTAWLGLMGHKLGAFWHGDERGRNQPIYFWRTYSTVLSATLWKAGIAFPFGLVAPFGAVGHVAESAADWADVAAAIRAVLLLGGSCVFCRGALPGAGAAAAHSLCRLWAVGVVGLGADEVLAQLGVGVGRLFGFCVCGQQSASADGHGGGCGHPLQSGQCVCRGWRQRAGGGGV